MGECPPKFIAIVVVHFAVTNKKVMITIEKIEIYKRFSGDIDGFSRIGSQKDKEKINENDWSILDEFIQDLELIKKGLASEEFKEKTNEKINELVNNDAIDLLNKLKQLNKRIKELKE